MILNADFASSPSGFRQSLVLLVLFFVFNVSVAQQLTGVERQIMADVKANMPATRELLERSVNINSGTFNQKGVRETAELYRKALEELGFATEWINLPDSLQRAGHLVASRKGTKGKKLFLVGHLDTVFEPDMPANPFTMLNDSTATGQGVVDMKGGDVLIIAALKALHQQGLLDEVTITVYMTGDEENAGEPREASRGDFIARARQHDIALAFEGAANFNTVATARRGASEWKLEVDGKQGHSSGIFAAGGYGSVYEAARIINAFRERLGKERYLSFNPGLFAGGSELHYVDSSQMATLSGKTNIISPKTVVIGDLRFLSEKQKENARATMRSIVSQSLRGTKASISFKDGIPAMPPTAGNNALVKKLSDISIAMGLGVVKAGDPGSRGAGDISYIAAYLDCLDGLGASGKGSHAPGEIIFLHEYPRLIQRTAILIYRLTR